MTECCEDEKEKPVRTVIWKNKDGKKVPVKVHLENGELVEDGELPYLEK